MFLQWRKGDAPFGEAVGLAAVGEADIGSERGAPVLVVALLPRKPPDVRGR